MSPTVVRPLSLAPVLAAGCVLATEPTLEPTAEPTPALDDVLAVAGDPLALDHTTCAGLPDRVPPPRLHTEVVYLSEELAFDGAGALVAKKGEFLLAVPPFGPSRYLSRDPALATLSLGLRYLPDGDLAVAQPAVEAGLIARILRVRPDGTVGDLFTAADMPASLPPFVIPNALAIDPAGAVFVTDFATDHIFRIAPDRSVRSLAIGPDAARAAGAAYDPGRRILYYTSRDTVRAVRLAADGSPLAAPAIVGTIPGTRLDGVTLDTCGNLYLVDADPAQSRFALWRLRPDGSGARQLATFDELVSGAQFGAGPGFDPRSVYVSSVVGKVFRVHVGVRGMS